MFILKLTLFTSGRRWTNNYSWQRTMESLGMKLFPCVADFQQCNPLRTPTSADFLRARTLTMTIHNELIDQKQMFFISYYLGGDRSTY